MTSKPRTPKTPRKKRKAYSSEINLKKEIKILKQNQEIMRKSFNRLNKEMKELKKNLNQKDNKSLPSGMYVG